MPKLKRTMREEENARLEANIRYYMWREELTVCDGADRLQVSERTVHRWLQDVGRLTWEDLISISMIFRCSVADLTGGELTFETKKRVIA